MKSLGFLMITAALATAAVATPIVAAQAQAQTPAQTEKPYTLGHVWRLSFIKFRAGNREKYLENLANNYVRELKVAQQQGTIISYKIIQGEAARPDDWNVIIMLELRDMAALGEFDARMEKAVAAAIGGRDEDEKGDKVRENIRDYLGIKSAREIIFK